MGSHQGFQVTFRSSIRNVGLLLRRCSGQGPHLSMTVEPRGFSSHTLKPWYLKLEALYFSKCISVGCTSLALFSPGHPEMFPSLTWLSASTESLSSLLGRSGADCLDPRIVPWLRSQHQTRSFCAVCSVLTMQRGEPEKVPEPRVLEAAGRGCALGKTTMRCPFTIIRRAIIQKTDNTK